MVACHEAALRKRRLMAGTAESEWPQWSIRSSDESPTTTHQYVEADMAMKEKALGRLQDPETPVRRFRATDSLLEFLKTL
jgi:hypothetical protein